MADNAEEPGPESEPCPDSVGAVSSAAAPVDADLGRYQLLFELARGGMGTVHVGRLRGAHGFDRLVAIKRLKSDSATEEDVAAFLSEARLTAQIKHPNVVQTLELGEHEGLPFLVMDLVEGVSLARLLKRIKKSSDMLDPHMAMWIISRAATGLHAAHELTDVEGVPLGLVHRDVSPENVLLSFEGGVYVADFGVAKFTGAERQTKSGVVKGKFAYMSPEQTEATALDRRSDVFALGIVLHECLAGQDLFAGNSLADTVRRIWQLEPPDPSAGRPEVPRELVPVVMRCLDKDRDRRYAGANEVADELRRIMRERGVAIDESDLAQLIEAYFPGERAKLKGRIRDAIRAAEDDDIPAPLRSGASLELSSTVASPPEPYAGATGSVTASVTTGPPLQPRSYAGAWLALAAVLLIGAGLWLTRNAAPVAPASLTTAAAPSSSPSPSDAALPPPAASDAPSGSVSASASASVEAPVPKPVVRPTPPGSKPPAAAGTMVRPRPPTPTSHKGKPFESLD